MSTLLVIITITTILSSTPSSASSHHDQIHGTKQAGFSLNLIHRDSPQSPFYTPNNHTKSDRIKAAVQRSRSRHRYLQSLSNKTRISSTPTPTPTPPNEPQPQVSPDNGEYVMYYSIGTPPVQTYAIADTASELIWLQCLPCEDCHKQKPPIFDPSQSSTYEILECADYKCSLTTHASCSQTEHTCVYSLRYFDGSDSTGDLSLETLTFNDDVPIGHISLSNMVIGCGHNNHQIPPQSINPPGIIGLNQKTLSFIKQLSILHFSYCLAEAKSNLPSRMHFQSEAVLFGGKTPLLNGEAGMDDAYYLYLEGISVGSTRLPLPAGSFNRTSNGHGGFMIDSGTSFTLLKPDAFDKLVAEMIKQLYHKVPSPEQCQDFMPCYKTTLNEIKRVAPDLTFHFSGLDLVLNKESTWMSVGQSKVCLAIMRAFFGDLSIFGNFQQQNMNVGFDLENKLVSFMNMEDCNSA